jgi:hypothetical protein
MTATVRFPCWKAGLDRPFAILRSGALSDRAARGLRIVRGSKLEDSFIRTGTYPANPD